MQIFATGYDLVDQVSILYATKGYVFKLPYKEFIIKPQDHLHRLNDALEDAKARKVSMEGGKLPLRTVCLDKDAKEAKAGEMSVLCFSDR